MSQSKAKKNSEKTSQKAPAGKSAGRSTPGLVADLESEEQSQFWQNEIARLRAQKFSSLEDAVSSLAENVLNRLGGSQATRADEKKFLVDLLLTDPELCARVRTELKIS